MATAPVEQVLGTFLSAIPSLPRPALLRLVDRAIERLDEIDGDPDLEEDDPSGQCDEDGINTGMVCAYVHGRSFEGAGCPISDPGGTDGGAVPPRGLYPIDQTKADWMKIGWIRP